MTQDAVIHTTFPRYFFDSGICCELVVKKRVLHIVLYRQYNYILPPSASEWGEILY